MTPESSSEAFTSPRYGIVLASHPAFLRRQHPSAKIIHWPFLTFQGMRMILFFFLIQTGHSPTEKIRWPGKPDPYLDVANSSGDEETTVRKLRVSAIQ